MKFTTNADMNGTHLQGYVDCTFAELLACFGPSQGGGDKTTQEWALCFADGTVATVYDWKMHDTPQSTYGWHVGGLSNLAVARIQGALRDHRAGIVDVVMTEVKTALTLN